MHNWGTNKEYSFQKYLQRELGSQNPNGLESCKSPSQNLHCQKNNIRIPKRGMKGYEKIIIYFWPLQICYSFPVAR